MERANARFASRCNGGQSTRSHHSATLRKRRANRRFATAAARELHARALHAHARFLPRAWSAERARAGAAW
eukprot:2992028-Lingulodinium_polyedra.AAC.1